MINNSETEMEDPVKKLAYLKKLTLENEKLMHQTLTLTWRNQTSFETFESKVELYLEKLQTENQKLTEELIRLTKRNNTLLAIQSKLFEKALEATMSKEAILFSQSIDTNVELGDEDTST